MVVASIFLQNIELVFNFLGAVCETMVAVILPCLFYVMLVNREEQKKKFIYYIAILVLVFIIPYSIFSVIASYVDFWTHDLYSIWIFWLKVRSSVKERSFFIILSAEI